MAEGPRDALLSRNSATKQLKQLAACGNEIFFEFTVVQTKISHVSKTTPLLGVICHRFGKTQYSLTL